MTRPRNYEGEPLVVIWSHTIMDGVVVRWYANLAAAEARDELGSASRTRVSTERLDLPDAVAMQMVAAHNVLRRGDVEAAKTLATHHRAWGGTITTATRGAV